MSLGPYVYAGFDTGSLSSYTVTDYSVPTVRITPKKHWNTNWLWWCVRSKHWAGRIPHFLIAKADRFAAPAANENLAVWATAADTDTWHKFDNQAVGASDIEFYHNTAFPGGFIYVAYLPIYSFSRLQRKLGEWIAADARITDTPSTTNNIISLATARDNGDGRIAPVLPFYAFMLTNASGFTKNTMVLASGNHPNETSGRFQLEGAMTWLLGGSAEAEFLLDWFNIYVYPCVNPQGVWGGYFRSCPEDPTLDHNRQWATLGTLECIDAFNAAMLADTGGTVEVGIDFHSSNAASSHYMDNEDHTATLYAAYLAKMQALDATYSFLDETVITMLHYLWRHTFSTQLAIVQEAMCLTSYTMPATWLTEGQNAMKSIAAMHIDGRWTNGPGVGSRDYNGTTDRIDWAAVYNPVGQEITVSAWIYLDVNNVNEYILCIHDAGDTSYGFIVNNAATGQLNVSRRGTTDYAWFTTTGPITTSLWHHILITSDGGLLSGSVALYVDGVSQAVSFTNGSGAETSHTGSLSTGGRIYNDTRNLNGKIAQVAVWKSVLTPTQIANLAAGQAADLVAPTNLQFYHKANVVSLVATPPAGGSTGVADGTAEVTGVGNGPSIIYG